MIILGNIYSIQMNKILLIVLTVLMFFSCGQKDKRQALVTIETKNDSEFVIKKDTFIEKG